jgi:hypothetical protein
MIWLRSLLSRLAGTDWRNIATAPFDRPIERAVIDSKIGVFPNFCLCHGNDWFDAETLRPVRVTATHPRFARAAVFPKSCC